MLLYPSVTDWPNERSTVTIKVRSQADYSGILVADCSPDGTYLNKRKNDLIVDLFGSRFARVSAVENERFYFFIESVGEIAVTGGRVDLNDRLERVWKGRSIV